VDVATADVVVVTEELLSDEVLVDELLLLVVLDVRDVGVDIETVEVVDAVDGDVSVEVETVDLIDVVAAVELKAYSSSLFPAPQYSVPSPGHVKLQSIIFAWVLPVCNVFPQ
jgi:hypothetical protein